MPLPYVLLHKRIPLRPRAFVKLPIRFVPTRPGPFSFTLNATVLQEGAAPYRTAIELKGEGFE